MRHRIRVEVPRLRDDSLRVHQLYALLEIAQALLPLNSRMTVLRIL